MINLFEGNDLSGMLQAEIKNIKNEIDRLTNQQICDSDIEELEEYYFETYKINQIELFMDNIEKDFIETKIKSYNQFYSPGDRYEPKYYEIDGYEVIFYIPFDGDTDLLYSRPSSRYLSRFSVKNIISSSANDYGKIVFSLEFTKGNLDNKEDLVSFIDNKFKEEFETYQSMIDNVNNQSDAHNSTLRGVIKGFLDARLKKASDYYTLREKLNIPLVKNSDAPNTKPILLKKVKKNKELPFPKQKSKQVDYSISENDYTNIKNIVNLACLSIEKTARTFSKLLEEELRDVILSNLNTHYQGTATGETFNKIGKSDIHIPFENKSAYIGECKIWHGGKKFNEAIQQLFGYTTWRDTKTSLIIFNKENKDFTKILETVDELLKDNPLCIKKMRLSNNKWQCTFKKYEGTDEIIEIDVGIYDLYI